ncbi:hypothetical protein F0344_22805 [Streptomyces finlayi]|uniref:Uncharacterized protein n=1 Tax=Streptomyces finlayi TaxID=67296 RepID=A0A7G7BP00_9ACTN|nr:hypothetical protein [Streptomyces finlayi]QNE77065.1 hypothetical protein F0344_22805 [Streptomyces finlayi]
MHPDIHVLLHNSRAAELQAEAARLRAPSHGLRTRLGWALVEIGLRLAQERPAPAAVRAPRTA